jgi:hypothetical protein
MERCNVESSKFSGFILISKDHQWIGATLLATESPARATTNRFATGQDCTGDRRQLIPMPMLHKVS